MSENAVIHPKKGGIAFAVLLILLISQNLIAILLAKVDVLASLIVLGLKDVLLFAGLATVLIHSKNLRSMKALDASILIVFALLATLSLVHHAPLMSTRQLLIIPLFMAFGSAVATSISVKTALQMTLVWSVIIAATGILELFFFYTTGSKELYWPAMGINEFLANKGMHAWGSGPGGVPGNFYSHDFNFLEGEKYRRLVGVIAEPTLVGHILVLPVVYYTISGRTLPAVFCSTALILTMSKGGILAAILGIGFYFHFYERRAKAFILTLFAAIAAVAGLTYAFLAGGMHSLSLHARGLVNNVSELANHPWGSGIGSAGNFANLAHKAGTVTTVVKGGGESYLGLFLGQLGIVGIVLYGILFCFMFRIRVDNRETAAIKLVSIATMIASFASESAVSYVGSGIFFTLATLVYLQQDTGVGPAAMSTLRATQTGGAR